MPSGYWQKRGNFSVPFLCSARVLFIYSNKKSKTYCKNFKTLSSSSPNNFLRHDITFRHTQAGAIVPLKIRELYMMVRAVIFLNRAEIRYFWKIRRNLLSVLCRTTGYIKKNTSFTSSLFNSSLLYHDIKEVQMH